MLKGKKRLRTIRNSVFPFTSVDFFARWMFTTTVKFVQVAQIGRFENSVCFLTRKILPKNRSLFTTNENESKASFCGNSKFLVNRTKITTGKRRLTSSKRAAMSGLHAEERPKKTIFTHFLQRMAKLHFSSYSFFFKILAVHLSDICIMLLFTK